MIGTIVKEYPEKVEIEIMKNDELFRKVTLIPEKEYIINQVNPRATKHRGRKVIFKSAENDRYGVYALVKYIDTKRAGRVDIGDLDNI
jgi:hypothetical protein